jgi:hypothetical protein
MDMIERSVPTTNNTQPQRPTYPDARTRKSATGPLISTRNIDEIVEANRAKRARKAKA